MRPKLSKLLRGVIVALVVMIVASRFAVGYWLNTQQFPYKGASPLMTSLAKLVYTVMPVWHSEGETVRVIKLASIMMSNSFVRDDISSTLDQMGGAFNVIDRYVGSRPDNMDAEAVHALVLERAIILNRINAIGRIGGKYIRRMDVYEILDELKENDTSDSEMRIASLREIMINQFIDERSSVGVAEHLADVLERRSSADIAGSVDNGIGRATLFYIGVGMCIKEGRRGGEYISKSVEGENGSKSTILYVIARNHDVPLLVAAAENVDCEEKVMGLMNLIGVK